MKTLPISTHLALPLDGTRGAPGAITQKYAFLGRTGSGKTYAATKLAELMLEAKAQIVALDPVGVWPFLRLGSRPFHLPVLGGLHGDVPLEPAGGTLVADFIVDTGSSVVIDVSQFSGAEQARFATDFATRFFRRKKAAPSAVHVFLEESQEFVPQNFSNREAGMVGAFERLVKLGRNFGIGVSLISQRPQEVNKKALNQTECLFAFQMTGPQERKAIAAWTHDKGLDVDIDAVLPKLAVGCAHVWSPQWLDVSREVKIAKKRTADGSATPQMGVKAKSVKLAPVDLSSLREAMSGALERAAADDPKTLRARIAELEKELRQKKPATAVKEVRIEVPTKVNWKGVERRLESELTRVFKNDVLRAALNVITDADVTYTNISKLPTTKEVLQTVASVNSTVAALKSRGRSKLSNVGSALIATQSTSDPSVGNGGLRRILVALAQRPEGLTSRQIGLRAGLSSKSGTFSTYLSKARQSGWIEDHGGVRVITPDGIRALGSFDPLPEGRELLQYWLNELGGGAARMLQALADAYPRALSNEQIGVAAGVSASSGTFSTYMSRMRGLELVVGGRGETCMSEELS